MDVMHFDTIIPANTPNLIANDILYLYNESNGHTGRGLVVFK